MIHYSRAKQFVDSATVPAAVSAHLEQLHVELDESKDSWLRFKPTLVGDCWLVSVEGHGKVHVIPHPPAMRANNSAVLIFSLRGINTSAGRQSFMPPPGQIMLSPWSDAEDIVSTGDFSYLCCLLPITRFPTSEAASLPYRRPIDAYSGLGGVLSASFRSLFSESVQYADTHLLSSALPHFLQFTLTALSESTIAVTPKQRPRRIQQALDFMGAHLEDTELSAAETAHACGMSLRSLTRAFSDDGTSFTKQLRHQRIERATQLLRNGVAKPITMISYQCGFSEPSVFCRAFKDVHGMSPRAFRDASTVGAEVSNSQS